MSAHVKLTFDISPEELASALARLSDDDIEEVLRLLVIEWVLGVRRRPKTSYEKECRARLRALCEHIQTWPEEGC